MSFIHAAVIGHPIKHSKSPIIHNHWIAHYGLGGGYEAIDIAPGDLADRVAGLVDEGYAGFNVTLPHKEAIFRLCDEIDEKARLIGAVNTVKIEHGKLYGTNTDAFGFIENVHQSAFGVDFLHRPAVVLGAGGAARAVVYALLQAGARCIIVTNRTRDKAEAIRSMDPDVIKVEDWDARDDILLGSGFLVNTTSLGMTGKEPLRIDLSALADGAVVADIVYAPLKTDLLIQAEEKGHQIVTGIGMLLHQARPAFEKWFGILPDVSEELERKVLA